MKELLEIIVKSIVDNEGAVKLSVVESESTIVIELSVAKEDMGKVIGRDGSMAWALRTLVTNAAAKHRRRAVLQILD
ncbi:MAG TPA: KH domain-containing protein [Myxococcota bacterium]|nr:KH domain-containing protein [Myxococcota bacterium]HOA13228.1 KH domain-containing protein [Myxococcota bacterium]HOC99837.1 KH domain-containing protein [Myxococcota bacterium]HOH76244.1 KH domain-containing protein [Myxococcota bacterium]HPV03013.1 KH domain-containing protein [Myxococcota bacterium]